MTSKSWRSARIRGQKKELFKSILRRRVANTEFTIISANCWGGSIYQDLSLPYRTPFVGLIVHAPDYLELLRNLKIYLKSDLSFITNSRYPEANNRRNGKHRSYPLGVLGGKVKLHFIHYKDEAEAARKWHSRLERINLDNLFIEFDDRYLCEEKHLQEFDRLNFPHKVVFTAKSHKTIKSAVWIREYNHLPSVKNLYTHRTMYKRHFDVADWLNGGCGKVGLPYILMNKLLEVSEK